MKSEVKIAVLENQITNIGISIDEIKNNHLVHIYKRIEKLERKVGYYIGGLAVLILSIRIIGPMIKF